jgi:hypothetical protein
MYIITDLFMCVHTFFKKKRAHMCVCIYINNFNRNTNLQGSNLLILQTKENKGHKHSPNLRAAGMFAFFPLHAGKTMKNGGQPDLDIS